MERVQQKRGVKLPPGVKSVARPSRWGNPYKVGAAIKLDGKMLLHTLSAEAAVALYRSHIERIWDQPGISTGLRDATGLACYCKPGDPCHADVLIEMLTPAPVVTIQRQQLNARGMFEWVDVEPDDKGQYIVDPDPASRTAFRAVATDET